MKRETLDRAKIQIPEGGYLARAKIDQATVADYATAYVNGETLPPVTVAVDQNGRHWLADGAHRIEALDGLEIDQIDAEIFEGTERDALWFAAGANARHGRRLTRADQQAALEIVLTDPRSEKMSNRAIARHVGCSHPTVGNVRRRLEIPEAEDSTDAEPEPPTTGKVTTPDGPEALEVPEPVEVEDVGKDAHEDDEGHEDAETFYRENREDLAPAAETPSRPFEGATIEPRLPEPRNRRPIVNADLRAILACDEPASATIAPIRSILDYIAPNLDAADRIVLAEALRNLAEALA